MKIDRKELYLNPIALLFLMARQTIKVLIAGRGFGKSFLIGVSIMMKLVSMPRSRGLLFGPTYTQILTNILLPMKSAWSFLGYKEGEDYVVGKRPPKHWDEPFQKPDKYDNVITWWNGLTIVLGSMDRPQFMRGGNFDWAIGDEVLLMKQDDYEQIIVPTVRGSHLIFQGRSGHLSHELFSSMPYGTMGAWLLEKKVEAENPNNDTFYIEGTSYHNRQILTDKVLKMWKRTMKRVIWLVEVMNVRLRQFGAVFYPSLTDRHWYRDSYNYEYIDTLGMEPEKLKRDCRWDNDFDDSLPINISHDFGAFNCITIDQEHQADKMFAGRETVRMINYMYVEHPRVLQDLAQDFCDYYKYTKCKRVYQWGDKSGNKSEANSRLTYFEEFAKILRVNGWEVILMDIGDAPHMGRHLFISDLHQENNSDLPIIRYNLGNCKDLRIALESTPMDGDKKDKKSERNKKLNPAHATHGTDAHDYRLWWGFKARTLDKIYNSPVSFNK